VDIKDIGNLVLSIKLDGGLTVLKEIQAINDELKKTVLLLREIAEESKKLCGSHADDDAKKKINLIDNPLKPVIRGW